MKILSRAIAFLLIGSLIADPATAGSWVAPAFPFSATSCGRAAFEEQALACRALQMLSSWAIPKRAACILLLAVGAGFLPAAWSQDSRIVVLNKLKARRDRSGSYRVNINIRLSDVYGFNFIFPNAKEMANKRVVPHLSVQKNLNQESIKTYQLQSPAEPIPEMTESNTPAALLIKKDEFLNMPPDLPANARAIQISLDPQLPPGSDAPDKIQVEVLELSAAKSKAPKTPPAPVRTASAQSDPAPAPVQPKYIFVEFQRDKSKPNFFQLPGQFRFAHVQEIVFHFTPAWAGRTVRPALVTPHNSGASETTISTAGEVKVLINSLGMDGQTLNRISKITLEFDGDQLPETIGPTLVITMEPGHKNDRVIGKKTPGIISIQEEKETYDKSFVSKPSAPAPHSPTGALRTPSESSHLNFLRAAGYPRGQNPDERRRFQQQVVRPLESAVWPQAKPDLQQSRGSGMRSVLRKMALLSVLTMSALWIACGGGGQMPHTSPQPPPQGHLIANLLNSEPHLYGSGALVVNPSGKTGIGLTYTGSGESTDWASVAFSPGSLPPASPGTTALFGAIEPLEGTTLSQKIAVSIVAQSGDPNQPDQITRIWLDPNQSIQYFKVQINVDPTLTSQMVISFGPDLYNDPSGNKPNSGLLVTMFNDAEIPGALSGALQKARAGVLLFLTFFVAGGVPLFALIRKENRNEIKSTEAVAPGILAKAWALYSPSILFVAIDQMTKLWIRYILPVAAITKGGFAGAGHKIIYLSPEPVIRHLIGGVNLVRIQHAPTMMDVLTTAITAYVFFRLTRISEWKGSISFGKIGSQLLFSGIFCNLMDYLTVGSVTDWLEIPYLNKTTNLSDIFLWSAAPFLLIALFKLRGAEKRPLRKNQDQRKRRSSA